MSSIARILTLVFNFCSAPNPNYCGFNRQKEENGIFFKDEKRVEEACCCRSKCCMLLRERLSTAQKSEVN